jgi:hypothetical protein
MAARRVALAMARAHLTAGHDKPTTVARFLARSATATDPTHPADARLLVDRSGGIPRVEALYDEVVALVASRPRAQVLPVHDGDLDRTYAGLLAALR